jgi:rhomboid family GlyGly-CTERM serine protease
MVFLVGCACISLAASLWPGVAALLVYERQAILQGELWRLVTGCLVHFSASHLAWDLLVLTAAGLALRARGHRGLEVVCLLSAVSSGIFLLVAMPEISRFGGLSGPATGAVVYLCLCEISRRERHPALWWAVLVLVGVKTIAELTHQAPIFASVGDIGFRVLPSAHLWGGGAALAAFWAIRPRALKPADHAYAAVLR